MANENLREYSDWRGGTGTVDEARGVIEGVKILGLESRNGRSYSGEALAGAAGLYEGAKVNVNHPKGSPWEARDYQDRIGVIRNVSWRAERGLYGDLHFNPKHQLAEQLAWDARHVPENVGFSHNVQARTARREGRTIVEEIVKVHSVDLVADPATTQGLFEETEAGREPDAGGETQELAALREELARLHEREAAAGRREQVARLLAEHGLPPAESRDETSRVITSAAFVAALCAAPGEEQLREQVADRARLVEWLQRESRGGGRPASREQAWQEAGARPRTVEEFVRALRGG